MPAASQLTRACGALGVTLPRVPLSVQGQLGVHLAPVSRMLRAMVWGNLSITGCLSSVWIVGECHERALQKKAPGGSEGVSVFGVYDSGC